MNLTRQNHETWQVCQRGTAQITVLALFLATRMADIIINGVGSRRIGSAECA